MQVGKISQQSFQANPKKVLAKTATCPECNQELDKKLNQAIERANSDVHPMTVVLSLASAATVGLGLMKCTPTARRIVSKAAEAIATTSVKVAGKFAEVIKKGEAFNAQGKLNKIIEAFDRYFEKFDVKDEKMMEGFTKFFKQILGENGGNKVIQTMTSNNITNKGKLFDFAVATGAGLMAIDPVSDATENHLDTKDILKVISEFV